MGPEHAQALTQRLITQWAPANIILVGIAARFDDEINLGDVLVSQQVFFYNPAKDTPEKLKYRPQGYPCSQTLIRQAEAMSLDGKVVGHWRTEAKKTAIAEADKLLADPPKPKPGCPPFNMLVAQDELRTHEPRIYFGTIASGSTVIDNPATKQELLALHGKLLGAEMEGAGMMFAVWNEELPPSAVVIKGVSDYADGSKSQTDAKIYWRRLATENSVRMAIEIIQRGRIRPLNTDRFYLDLTKGSPAEAWSVLKEKSVGAAALAFPRLVIPEGPITELRLNYSARDNNGPLPILVAKVRYTDRAGETATMDIKGDKLSWKIEWPRSPIGPQPIGLFFLVQGTPQVVDFKVSTAEGQPPTTASWVPQS
jgi:nucleoside phosphorylase